MPDKKIVLLEQIEPKILLVRDERIILDVDLAALFGVTTKRLNEQVKRNQVRFPPTFMFKLTESKKAEVVANCDHLGNLKYSSQIPNAFTEHGAIMAASILNSPIAVEVSIFVVKAFVKLRQLALNHQEIQRKLTDLERTVSGHDDAIQQIVAALRQLMVPKEESKPKRRIGFHAIKDDGIEPKGKK
ncbi:MAG: ORF6N domain-containing protein [Gemmataceae bacterium]|nr:ORF6N domain-containing protein [Gemmataceae bacterium]